MQFTFTDEQRAFQRAVRDFLAKECPPERVVSTSRDNRARIRLWHGLGEIGVMGLTVPEKFGGLGSDELDLVLPLEEAGRAAVPLPLVETAAVAVAILKEAAPTDIQAEWLPRIAKGIAEIAVAIPGLPGALDANRAPLLLLGRADTIRVLAGGDLSLFDPRSIDETRHFQRVEVPDTAGTVIASGDAARSLLEAAFDRGALCTAAVLCGIADRAIELAASYAKERQQFGKPIGSFQAVKHLLADALLGLEFARPVVYRAAWSVATGDEQSARHVSMAKAYASDAAMNACRAALQVHGAIGYTHEHDLHLWLNKATALAHAWGTAAWHRERIAL